jgi:high affinity Mn2+ porin
VIAQGHGNFHALYSGTNSLSNQADAAVTSVEDFFSGFRVTRDFDLLFDVEDVRGSGLSNVLGLAGFTDLDAQKTPTAGNQPHTYMSRFLFHYVLDLGGDPTPNVPSFLELGRSLPSRRIELYFGKFSLADFFDQNDYAGSDHSQFLNWTTDQNGAWDYAANTPGYTYGAYLEFDDRAWSLRYAEALMSRVPNGLYLSLHLSDTRSENAEVDWSYSPQMPGTVRLLGYVDEAPMGSFAAALAAWRENLTPAPDTAAVRRPGRHEYGFGWNWQQGLPRGFGLFARAGWNNGTYESYEYTEVNNTVEAGIQIPGELWGRRNDHAGFALASNGISRLHREYLAAGGLGFQLGDGGLTYGRERILEGHYNWKLPLGLSTAPDVQFIANPGYNRVRGPVTVFSLRLNWNLGFHPIR